MEWQSAPPPPEPAREEPMVAPWLRGLIILVIILFVVYLAIAEIHP